MADVQKILALVAEGKLTAEEADEILSAMAARESGAPARTTHLRIEVTDGGRSVVNLRVPLNVAGWASNFLPGISEQDADRIRGAVASGTRGAILDITDNDGSRVLITSE
ncbi:MAG: hypothetical protein ABI797_04230 [Chloroflexota bacterium]